MNHTFSGTYTKNSGALPAAGTVTIKPDDGSSPTVETLDGNGHYSVALDLGSPRVTIVEAISGLLSYTYEVDVLGDFDTSRDVGRIGSGATPDVDHAVPPGGVARQRLAKNSETDYDASWTYELVVAGEIGDFGLADGHFFYVDATGGSIAGTLPVPDNGVRCGIKRTDSSGNAVTLHPHGGESIDGGGTLTVPAGGGAFVVVGDGSNWQVESAYNPAPNGASGQVEWAGYVTSSNGSGPMGFSSDAAGFIWEDGLAASWGGFYPTAPAAIAYNGTEWLASLDSADLASATTLCLARSTDGKSWTPCLAPFSSVSAICWAGDAVGWVISGHNNADVTRAIATSPRGVHPDGSTWTTQSTPGTSGGCSSIAWDGTNLLANLSDGATAIASSPDGAAWTFRSSPFDTGVVGIATDGSTWVAVDNGGNVESVMTASASDLTTWTTHHSPADGIGPNPNTLVWDGSHFWCNASNGSAGADSLMKSADGATWSAVTTPWNPQTHVVIAIAWNGTALLVATPSSDGKFSIATTSDGGTTWTPCSSPQMSSAGGAAALCSRLRPAMIPPIT